MDLITEVCPRFRVLIVGKSGVGKSSLTNHIFKIDSAHVSDYKRGIATIDDEFTSPLNRRFVLHDSQGYEPGETKHFDILRNFIDDRMRRPDVGERLHAIWLCIATPFAGGRVFETGDEKIFKLNLKSVPVVVVFTKYDQLVAQKEGELMRGKLTMDGAKLVKEAKAQAARIYADVCVQQLKAAKGNVPFVNVSTSTDYEDSLQKLVQITLKHMRFGDSRPVPSRLSRIRNLFSRQPSGDVNQAHSESQDLSDSAGLVLATAQGVDIDSKTEASIK